MSARPGSRGWLALAFVALGAHGCTVIALDGISLPMCASHADCEPLNADEGIAFAACERYQCNHQNGRCEMAPRDHDDDGVVDARCPGGADCDDEAASRKPGAPEVCDGADDDCDGVVDEGALGARAPGDVVSNVAGLSRASYGAAGGGTAGAAYGSSTGDQTLFATLAGGAPAADMLELKFAATGTDTEQANDPTAGKCWQLSSTGTVLGTCTMNDAAVASASDHAWFVAAVNQLGCGAGQLRVGLYESASRLVELRGPASRSNVYAGVDVQRDDPHHCSGASRASGVPGVARPAVAAMSPPQGINALVATLARAADDPALSPLSDEACTPSSATATDVEVLGLQLKSGTAAATPVEWLTGTNGGVPQPIGRTHSSAPPALAAYPYSHYFLAFAGETGGVELHAVRAITGPALEVVSASPATLAPGSRVHRVAVATGDVTAAGVSVAVAWDEGCSGGASDVYFARTRFDTARETFGAFETPIKVSTSGAAFAPSLAFVRDGFVSASYPGGAAGGWVVAWVDHEAGSRRVLARRVLAADGPLLDEPAFDLTSAAGQGDPAGPYLYPGATAGTLRFAYADTGRGAIVGGDLLCTPGP